MIKKTNIVVIGLGYVGLTLAVTMAECGFRVYGYEKDKTVRNKLKKKQPHFYEPNLQKKLSKQIYSKNLIIINTIEENNEYDCFIVAVGTPLNKNNKPDLETLINATKEISIKMNEGSLLIYRSTVPPGTSKKILIPILNRSKKNFDFCFCPERTAQGVALKELRLMPQIIGGKDNQSSKKADKIFRKITKKNIIVSNTTTAEMIKCVDNTQRDTKFAYANEIAIICNKLKINSGEVLHSAHKGYPRTSLFLPGPVGGPCLSKDSYLLLDSFNSDFKRKSVIYSSRKINESLVKIFDKYITNKMRSYKRPLEILILGLTFKGSPQTDDLRGSIALDILSIFRYKNKKNKIYAFDNHVKKNAFVNLGITEVKNLNKSFSKKDLVIIANNNKIFGGLEIEKLMKILNKNAIVYDFWNFYNYNRHISENNSFYVSFGNHQ